MMDQPKSKKNDVSTQQSNEAIRKLLETSRQKVSQGKPTEALEGVIEAIRRTQG